MLERKKSVVAKSRANKVKKSNVAQKASAKVPASNPAPANVAPEQKTNEAQIAVHWKEEDSLRPPASFVAQANLVDATFVNEFREEKFPECFRHYANLLDWDSYWHTTLDTSEPPFWKWFVGGKLNVCYNCVDRHLEKYKNKAALIFVPEPEQESATVITYQELYRRVNEVA